MFLSYFALMFISAFLPLGLAIIFIWIFRKIVDRDSCSRDFISGLIFLQGTRESFKNLRSIFKVGKR